jgi:DNA polymerase/3'-5' exonuclease PolX
MNSTSIAEYILKLEKLNEESRSKIEQLKNLLDEANEERVRALEEVNKKSLFETTSNPVSNESINTGIARRLRELGDMTADFYKDGAYKRAATIIEHLPYEVESGESVLHINGIGKSIATKIDEYIDELDSDYEESVASNDYSSDDESDDEPEEDSDDEYVISYNTDIYNMLRAVAAAEKDVYKKKAYNTAAEAVFYLPYAIKDASELCAGPNKVAGIGKSIAKKINDFLGPNKKLADLFLRLGNLEENKFKSEVYWNASDVLKSLPDKIERGFQVKNLSGFGKSICDKIDEFTATGKIKRLDDLKSK